jgi:lipid II:glycine glycyltransferase (peptidoglycan interpeptide bridge formation enzyme)
VTIAELLPQTTPTRPLVVQVTTQPPAVALADWEALVRRTEGADVAQLPAWSRLRAGVGFRARYVLVHHGATLVGGAQLLERALPVLGRIGYLPYGPLVAAEAADPAAVRTALCDALERLARRELRALFVQPPTGADGVSVELGRRGFRASDAGVAPGATLRVDLSQDVAALRSGLAKRLRTWTNRWAARGVTVRRGTEADLPLLAELVADSGRHQRFAAVSEDYLRSLYRELGEDAVLFVAEVRGTAGTSGTAGGAGTSGTAGGAGTGGTATAAALYTRSAGVLTLRFAGMDRAEPSARLNVSGAVQWHALCWAKGAGLAWFDLGGIAAESADVLAEGGAKGDLRGIDRFKASLGGSVHRYPPAVELIAGPLARTGYDVTRRWAPGRRALERAKRLLRTGRLATR